MRNFPQLAVEILIDDVPWQSVAALDQAGPDDLVYQLDPQTGRLRFGDGLHGCRLPTGARIQATYRHGVGETGNIASASWSWVNPEPRQVVLMSLASQAGSIHFRLLQARLTWRSRLAAWLCAWLWGG